MKATPCERAREECIACYTQHPQVQGSLPLAQRMLVLLAVRHCEEEERRLLLTHTVSGAQEILKCAEAVDAYKRCADASFRNFVGR